MKPFNSILFWLMIFISSPSQATFSIVAIDPVTGEIGSAGASCVSGAGNVRILSDVILGMGVIHTQAYYLPSNQDNARVRMELGDDPGEILTWLAQNDSQGNPSQRQYLVVAMDGASETYTGTNTDSVTLGVSGLNYAIAGNILLEADVVYDMETAFLNTSGSLADKLMAALQAAKRVGADSRCGPFNISSAGAFIRVANQCDSDSSPGQLSLDLQAYVESGGPVFEPIDALQADYDQHTSPACEIDLIFGQGFEAL